MKQTAGPRPLTLWLDRANNATYGRLLGFAVVGGSIFIANAAMLFGLVHFAHVEAHLAYFLSAVVSIEANFVLNRTLNWRDRSGSIIRQLAAFHVTKIVTLVLTQLLFALLLALGVWYMFAMVLITGAITIVNFLANDRFVFRNTSPAAASPVWDLEAGTYS